MSKIISNSSSGGWPMFNGLRVTYADPSRLKPYPGNARTHPRKQIDQLKASINKFGFTNPILVDANSIVIAGHGRLLAAKELGLSEVPVITLGNLSPEQVRALRLADNKLALNSGWDPDLLRVKIGELQSLRVDMDLSITGFSVGEIGMLLTPKKDSDEDVLPPFLSEPRSRLGDIWQIGEHRVGCGDSRDLTFVREVVGDGVRIDCAFLDPPWNVRVKGHANVKSKHREFAMASGEMSEASFRTFLVDALQPSANVSRDGAVHFVCIDWRHLPDLDAAAQELYREQINLYVWNKSNAGMGSLYRSKHELIGVYRVGARTHTNTVELGRHGRNRTNVWDYPSVNTFSGNRREDLALHPTAKPVALVVDAIQDVTRRGEIVFDSFLGSGTTLIAAERAKRRFRGLDIDPGYVDVAIDRWAAVTGLVPHRIVAGAERMEPLP